MANILLVEDEDILRDLIRAELAKEGHDIREAHNGEQAEQRVMEQKPDLILLDLLMPILSGYDVLDWLKSQDAYKDIPCIVISNSGQAGDLQRVREKGADDVLVKVEFTPDQVAKKVRHTLSQRSV